MNTEKKYSGLLFIGDPHVTCVSPKRRTEDSFIEITIDKLSQSLNIADENNLFPICLGDIVNKPNEPEVVVPLIDILKNRNLLMPVGNHDVNVRKIFKGTSDESIDLPFNESSSIVIPVDNSTTVGILKASGCIDLINKMEERQILLDNNTLTRVLFIPYGVAIPEVFPEYNGKHDGDIINVMVTHHDINFGIGIQYPGSQKVFPIENCDLVVNGHIHDYKPPLDVQDTKWFNPGNIIRTSKSVMHNEPSVYSIKDKSLNIEKHVLDYKRLEDAFKEDFNLIREGMDEDILENFNSEFVDNLKGTLDDDKTLDGSGVEEIVFEHLRERGVETKIQEKIVDLMERAIEKNN